MKEIERYKITSSNGNSSNVTKCDDGHWVNFADVEQLQARIKDLKSRMDSCLLMDKQNQSIIEQAENIIKELESEKHINEIKAQGIEEAIKKADNETYIGIVGQEFPPQSQYKAELLCYAEQLRTKHD